MLGEAYHPDDEEDSSIQQVTGLSVLQARYRIPVGLAIAGNIVLLEGVDATVTKTATLVPEFLDQECFIFRPLQFANKSVMKIATEPLNPADLPKMVEGLRKINKSYPLAVTKARSQRPCLAPCLPQHPTRPCGTFRWKRAASTPSSGLGSFTLTR